MLTVFTPAYNRGGYLKRLYESLLCQSNQDFEWLIVDDGSTDDTASVVAALAAEGKLNIRYHKKENGGKHTAYNQALELAAGDWFVCVDSDDMLAPDAVQALAAATATLPGNTGVAAYKTDMAGKRLSDAFPPEVATCKISELSLKRGCKGEFTFVFPTKIAKKYPFPVFSGEKFVLESVIYDRIEQECVFHLLPQVITVCEYLEDGYSQNYSNLLKKNPSGVCVYFMQRVDVAYSASYRLSSAGKYWAFRWLSRNRTLKYRGPHRLACAAGWLLGLAFFVYYKVVRGF